ncbi:FAD-binding domain-containing protein [Rhizodiscina lignyota]|uniref:FAD-binding domain-containing protein n=1 Tax=Rhizodiscina lignyota TaxID=1504668 RepID=A0A9P4IEB2_9PEZI|nr:FAD-binding domain-containing protein [Rhizodiscina lignyota]
MRLSFTSGLAFTLLASSVTLVVDASAQGCPSDCLTTKGVPYVNSTDAQYANLSAPFNLRLPYKPVVIVLPTTPQHVSDAVVCASESGIKVASRSGGHSYAAFGLGGQNGSMVIDVRNFQDFSIDSNQVAKVGGGMRLGTMAQKLFNEGTRALPHGTCSGIGIGGHATHGGYGYSSRLWGLTLDHIIAMDAVLPNGTYITTSMTSYPEIFYALRGAAEFFGVVLNFYFQTEPAPSDVVWFTYTIPGLNESVEKATSAFIHLQDFARNSSVVDENLSFGTYVDRGVFLVRGIYTGTLASFDPIVTEMLRGLPSPSQNTTESIAWLDALTILDGTSLNPPVNEHDNFFAKSVTVPEISPLTEDAVTNYFTYLINEGANPDTGSWFSICNLYGGPGSQINTKTIDFAAYSDRDALWVFQHYSSEPANVSFPATAFNFVQGMNTALEQDMPNTTFGAYLNYIDPSLTPAEAHEEYYGSTLYAKLLALKEVVDPGNIFWNPQAIGA